MFCILEGPEDDPIRIETCCPNTIINIIKSFVVFDTSLCIFVISVYVYARKHQNVCGLTYVTVTKMTFSFTLYIYVHIVTIFGRK